jgi:hypothetical protein
VKEQKTTLVVVGKGKNAMSSSVPPTSRRKITVDEKNNIEKKKRAAQKLRESKTGKKVAVHTISQNTRPKRGSKFYSVVAF